MSNERLSNLTLLHLHLDIPIDTEKVIDECRIFMVQNFLIESRLSSTTDKEYTVRCNIEKIQEVTSLL